MSEGFTRNGRSQLNFYMQPDVKAWLAQRAGYFGCSMTAELTRIIREKMEAEASR